MREKDEEKPEFIDSFFSHFTILFAKQSTLKAEVLADKALSEITRLFGGQTIYLPSRKQGQIVLKAIIDSRSTLTSANADQTTQQQSSNRGEIKRFKMFLIMEQLLQTLHQLFQQESRSEPMALAKETVLVMCDMVNGIQVYIPRLQTLLMKHRNQEIVCKFNGTNIMELAREYQLTEARIYEILQADRKKRRADFLQQA